ncbi:MAG TPA: DUF1549 domain-containing protein [Gemmataceae bacterium]|nr:DUF1549 domain-containing protein [Gemmataceae bacterium]
MAPHRSPPCRQVLFATLTLLGIAASAPAQEKPLRQVIDAEVRSVWQREKLAPAPRSADAAFLRRIYLDLVGTIPTAEEAKHFRADADAKKHEKLIDRLLADPRFATHQADVWDLTLFGRNQPDFLRKRDDFKKWLADQFSRNVPYDRWVRDLLLAEQDGSEMFLAQFRNQPEDATVAVTRIFLGTQLQCARCHDHPFENRTQREFYGMAGFFVRLVVLDGGGPANKKRYRIGEKSTGEVLFTGSVKEQRPGQKGVPVKPRFLGGPDLDEPPAPKGFKEPPLKPNQTPPKPAFSRKEKLAAWLTTPENPFFARAVANRLWAQFMGRGLVDPVDDLSETKKGTHPALLDALTRHLVATKFDLKGFFRELANSETYQLACSGKVTEALPTWFERARVRPLSSEELLASIRTATGFDAAKGKLNSGEYEYFLRYFGEPVDGQGTFQGNLGEHLFLNNSSQLRGLIQPRKGNLADTLLSSKSPWEERVEQLFLSVLSRPPSAAERQRFVQHLTSDGKATPALVEEAIWVLLSCSEFRFNH